MSETVEVVIRLPEKTYRKILSNEYDYGDMNVIIQAGIPLPKGHGALKDVDKIIYYRCPDNVLDCPQFYDFTCQHCDFGIATRFRTDSMPTIIEADKESEVDNG